MIKNHRVKFALCLLTIHIWMTAQCKVQQPVDKNFAPKKRNQSRENERAWFCCSGGWVARLFNHAHRTFWGWRWAHSRSKLSPSTSKVSTKYFLHPPSPLSLIGQLTDQVVVDVQWSVRNWVRNVEHGEKMVHADWSLQSASPIVDHPLNQSKLRFGRGHLWPKAQIWKKVCTLSKKFDEKAGKRGLRSLIPAHKRQDASNYKKVFPFATSIHTKRRRPWEWHFMWFGNCHHLRWFAFYGSCMYRAEHPACLEKRKD